MQSSSQIVTTNKPTSSFFTGRIPFLSPNQQCQSTEGKNITFHGLAYPELTWGLPTLSLTTNSSWLPCCLLIIIKNKTFVYKQPQMTASTISYSVVLTVSNISLVMWFHKRMHYMSMLTMDIKVKSTFSHLIWTKCRQELPGVDQEIAVTVYQEHLQILSPRQYSTRLPVNLHAQLFIVEQPQHSTIMTVTSTYAYGYLTKACQ